MLGFQTWLGAADPKEQWPLAIQKDGLPRDLIDAQLADDSSEDIERLTIRAFGVRCADAASRGASFEGGRAIRVPAPKRAAADPAPEKDRKLR